MKVKLAILTLTVLGIGIGGISVVNGQQAAVDSTPVQSSFKTVNMTSVIDDIEIPFEVLEYVQLTYDGHAVTKAEKIQRDGQELYKLRVDRDDQINDSNSIALLYTMNWKLVGSERAAAPPAPEPAPKPKKVESDNDEKPRVDPVVEEKPVEKPKPEGGRGAQGEEPAETTVTEKPEEPVNDEERTTEPSD